MISDYTILTSFLLSALLFLSLGYTKIHFYNVQNDHSNKSQKQIPPPQIDFEKRLNYLLIFMVLFSRLAFVLTFPIELNALTVRESFLSFRSMFLLSQGLIIFGYLFIYFHLLLQTRLTIEHRRGYIRKVLNYSSFFIIIELLISFIFYSLINYDLLFQKTIRDMPQVSTIPIYQFTYGQIFILVGYILFLLFFILVQRKRNLFNLFGFFSSQPLVSIGSLLIISNNLPYFFEEKSLLYSGLTVFEYSGGFTVWIIFLILCTGLASQFFSFGIIRLKDRFINRQIAMNYLIQLSRVSLVSVTGMVIFALLPALYLILI